MSKTTLNNHLIALTNEEKIFFPKSRISKGQLLAYYQTIAPHCIPLIANHPIAMNRFPDGIDQEGFYQKNADEYYPSWIKTAAIKQLNQDVLTNYVLCNDAATLIYIINQGTITLHTWLSTAQKKNYPDRMVFDLDPPDEQHWPLVKKTARALKKLLESYHVHPFVMTTGSKGLHVVVPLKQTNTFATVHEFAHHIAQEVIRKNSEQLTLDIRKEHRKNKLLIDIERNRWAQLTVAPYSVRAKEGAPIAAPLDWSALKNNRLHPQYYTINNIHTYLKRSGNPWRDFYSCARAIPKR